jgi:mannose-6-phosphate isomerase-like protein (cupin superfamily)
MSLKTLQTKTIQPQHDVIAPDGSKVRLMCDVNGASSIHIRLEVGQVSHPVAHHKVAEIWYVLAGEGEMWRQNDVEETITQLHPHICLNIPAKTHFQFRNTGKTPLEIFLVTIPAWQDDSDAYAVQGKWQPTTPT